MSSPRRDVSLGRLRDGPIDLRVLPSKFVLRLCLRLGILEGSDLSPVLVVELLQSLLFANGVLAIESLLLLIAI